MIEALTSGELRELLDHKKAENKTLKAENERYRKAYDELIYHVETKHPNQTRHETALMYIKNAENRDSSQVCKNKEALDKDKGE